MTPAALKARIAARRLRQRLTAVGLILLVGLCLWAVFRNHPDSTPPGPPPVATKAAVTSPAKPKAPRTTHKPRPDVPFAGDLEQALARQTPRCPLTTPVRWDFRLDTVTGTAATSRFVQSKGESPADAAVTACLSAHLKDFRFIPKRAGARRHVPLSFTFYPATVHRGIQP